jgi:integrase/recombinase XerC
MILCIDDFLATCYGWEERTIETCRRHLEYWRRWLDGREIEKVTIAEFEAWSTGNRWSATMRYNSLWAIKSWLQWAGLKSHELLTHSVQRKLPPRQRTIRLEELQQLVDACDTSTARGLQEATLLAFLWETWARASSVIAAKLSGLDLEAKEVTLHVKGNRWHTPVFGPDLYDLLTRWLSVRDELARPGIETIFVNPRTGQPLTYWVLRQILMELGARAGVPNVTAHAFRRGGARHHADQGGSDRQGMEQGGWRSFQVYWRYTRGVSLEPLKTKCWRSKSVSGQVAA